MPIGSRFYLAGPTASGKSDLAAFLAARWGAEVVNADAFQLYEKLPILTAWSDLLVLGEDGKPHCQPGFHLYGVLPLSEQCDAEKYASWAKQTYESIESRGKKTIVVGGSGLYLKALTHGLSPFPKSEELRRQLATLSVEGRVKMLLELDPEAGSRISLQNDRYVTRALEIIQLTGLSVAEQKATWEHAEPRFQGVVLAPERDWLRNRIVMRAQSMVKAGVLDEVRAAEEGEVSRTAQKAIGYQEFKEVLEGKTPLSEALTRLTHATWQLAKRQRTWFRRERGFESIELNEGRDLEMLAQFIEQRFEESSGEAKD